MRVFVNDRAVDVPRGARVRDAVAQADDGLAKLLDGGGAAYVTDAAGRPIDAGDAVGEAGSVYRVIVSARREGKLRLTKAALRRWRNAELHVHLDGAMPLAQAIEAPLAGIRRASAETGTKVGLIVCAMRTRAPAESLELAREAAEYHSAGVTAFDLAGAERGHPARDHRAAFEYAAAHGMACTCHAGEGDGPHSIHQALHDVGAQRIGHGTRLAEDPALLEEVVARKIPLEMCLTSNVHTHVVPSVAEHPFKRYFQQGVVVTLNTDGPLTDGISLTDEYFLAHAVLGLSPDELQRVVLNACESAFLPEYEKVALVSRVQSELDGLGGAS